MRLRSKSEECVGLHVTYVSTSEGKLLLGNPAEIGNGLQDGREDQAKGSANPHEVGHGKEIRRQLPQEGLRRDASRGRLSIVRFAKGTK